MVVSREQNNNQPKITIVGAGLVGLCTALELQERGRKVELIDRLGPAEATSYGNAGMLCSWSVVPEAAPGIWKDAPAWLLDRHGPLFIRPSYLLKMIPWLWRFVGASRKTGPELESAADAMLSINHPVVDLYRHYLAGTGHEHLIIDADYLHLYRDSTKINESGLGVRLRRDRGADISFLNEQELREAVPALSDRFKAAMRLGGQAYTINPGKLGKVLAEKVQRQNGEIIADEILNCKPVAGGFELTTSSGTRSAEQLVIAAGAWSHRLTRQLGTEIPLEAERGYHVVLPDAGIDIPMPLMNTERHFAVTPMEMGLRIAGTAEFAGVDAAPNYSRAAVLERLAKEMFPDLNTDGADYWMGPRPSLPDTVPIVSALPDHTNAWVTCGHGHLGLTGAPMSGRLIAEMVEGDRSDVDLSPYRVDRFSQ